MNMPPSQLRIPMAVLLAVLTLPVCSAAYDDVDTHPRMTAAALTASSVDAVLKSELDIAPGLGVLLQGKSPIRWAREGSTHEDALSFCNASNHFHDPRKRFLDARMSDADFFVVPKCGTPTSSVVWGTRFIAPTVKGPAVDNPFDWDITRIQYFQALTLGSAGEREASLAGTFFSLGHVMHLVQDAAQPAHVRNDMSSHFGFFPNRKIFPLSEGLLRWAASPFERFVSLNRRLVDDAEIFRVSLTGRSPAEVFDRDLYDGTNPTADPTGVLGLAEWVNANFASTYTILTETLDERDPHFFPYPRRSSTNLDELYDQSMAIVHDVPGLDGKIDTRIHISKVKHGVVIPNFAHVNYLARDLVENSATSSPALFLDLDDVAYADHARLLLPRAIGYSAALADYFFRGRLDVDLVDAGNGPALVGRNISGEALDGGTLRVYADGVGAMDGQRFQASADTEVGLVAHDGALPPVAVTLPPEAAGAERFVAVYTGVLGAERPDTGTIGAVIGKVLGGTRVEQLFSDGNRWNIRTPDGIYPLPILNDIQELVWGDADNILVGRTAIGAAAPNQFVVYQIDRGAGDPAIPLTGSGEVRLVNANPPHVGFPVDLPIASVSVTQTMRFKQYLPAALHDVVDPDAETWEFDANLAVNEERQTTRTRELRLDFNTFQSLSSDGHSWRIENIYGDGNGDIFALITSTLRLRNEFQTFPTKKYVDVCGGWPCPTIDGPPRFFQVTLPTSGLRSTFGVLINVTKGEVRSVTAPSAGGIAQIRLSHTTSHVSFGSGTSSLDLPSFTVREVRRQNGLDGAPTFVQFDDPTFACSDTVPHFDVGGVSVVVGTLGADVPLYRADLAAATGPSRPPAMQSSVRKLCIDEFHRPLGKPIPMMTFPLDQFTFTSDRIDRILRARADGNRWAVLITKTSAGVALRQLVRWDPDGVSASLRATMQESFADLISTSTRRATVATDSQLIVVPLDGDANVVSSPADFASASGYIALEPSFIYRPSDGRFYRVSPTLQQTALPRPLASSGPLSGSYHTLKLR